MKGLLEYKNYNAEIKDMDSERMTVTGYFASFGNEDYDDDIIMPGAATKTIAERGPKGSNEIFFLNQHNYAQPHGKPMVLEAQERGIYFESKIAPTSYGRDAMILYAEGIVVQHSIGFSTIKSDYDQNTGMRMIKEIKLYEGSNVTLGANPNTPFTGFKSLTMGQINDQISKMIKLLKDGSLTDDGFGRLEIALKQFQLEAYNLGKNSLADAEPTKVTLPSNEPNILTELIKHLEK
jgi:HK97 family phage prohead protease